MPSAALIQREGVNRFAGKVWSVQMPLAARRVGPDEERSFLRADHQYYFTIRSRAGFCDSHQKSPVIVIPAFAGNACVDPTAIYCFFIESPVTRPSVLCANRIPYTPSVDLSLPAPTSSALL